MVGACPEWSSWRCPACLRPVSSTRAKETPALTTLVATEPWLGDFRLWLISELVARLIDVRSWGRRGRDLLIASITARNPQRTFNRLGLLELLVDPPSALGTSRL